MRDLHAEWIAAMRRGDDEAAWAVCDVVLAARDPARRDDASLPYHERWVWDGQPPDGREIVVRCYHGLGDTLQYARFLPELRQRARSVIVEMQPELMPLLANSLAGCSVVPFAAHAPIAAPGRDIEIMELAHALRVPARAAPPPYLRAAPATLPPGTIGLCCQAGGWDTARSFPASLIAPLLAGHPVLMLQPGAAPVPAINPEGAPPEPACTASLIAGLDRVITADTMVAHLAGAMGRPTWLLLKHDADWRWGDTARSAWYPSMRLFRQPAPGDWGSVIAEIAAQLMAGD